MTMQISSSKSFPSLIINQFNYYCSSSSNNNEQTTITTKNDEWVTTFTKRWRKTRVIVCLNLVLFSHRITNSFNIHTYMNMYILLCDIQWHIITVHISNGTGWLTLTWRMQHFSSFYNRVFQTQHNQEMARAIFSTHFSYHRLRTFFISSFSYQSLFFSYWFSHLRYKLNKRETNHRQQQSTNNNQQQ